MNYKKSLKKLDFSYDLAGLSNYVDQLNTDIIQEAVLSPITMSYVNTIVGIKGTQNVNLLSETLVVQNGNTCGFENSGATTFTTAALTVGQYKVNQSLCLQSLNELWLGQFLNQGSYNEQAPFEQAIVDLQTRQIKRFNEDTLWQATSGSSSFSGFIELFANTAGVVKLSGQTALCSITGSTTQEKANRVLAAVDSIIDALDRNIFQRDDVIIYMGLPAFKCYLTALRNVNNFHIDTRNEKLGQVYEVYHPQTNFKVVGCPGLNTNLIAAGPMQMMLVGTDLMSDEDSFRSWWSMDFQEVRIMSAWKLGTQLAFPEFFVTNGL
jgi:hypothetical protein